MNTQLIQDSHIRRVLGLRGAQDVFLEQGGLIGAINYWTGFAYMNESHVLRLYTTADVIRAVREDLDSDDGWIVPPTAILVQSFGNYRSVENRLVELLAHPAWTLLKYA